MADNISALRAELVAALAVLEPQIRGMIDITNTSISPDLVAQINTQIVNRSRRRDLIQNALNDLDALVADGYPLLANATLPNDLFTELQGEETDLDAAMALFEEALPATVVSVDLGTATDKPV